MTYKEIAKGIEGRNIPLAGVNENGERIVVGAGITDDGEHYYSITTYQKNGWARTNNYYEDGTVEELYSR